MIGKSLLFSAIFLGLDLIIYFLLSMAMALILRDLPFIEVIRSGSLLFLSRIIYLQAICQFFLLVFVRYYNVHTNFLVVIAACVFAFLLPSIYFLKEISGFLSYFTFSAIHKDVGPGLLLIASVSLAWLAIFKITNISKTLG